MLLSAFTFVRNAVKYDYPIVEAIRSILPIVDEFVVSIGNSDDATLELIQSINSPKIKIFHSVWDDRLREGGRVLAVETDKALAHISPEAEWAFYLQADEVVHEQYLPAIQDALLRYRSNFNVEGLLFKYLHLYGTYDYAGDSRKWYNREVRIIRNNPDIHSWKDAQGFRIKGRKLRVKPIPAYIYHYGWVKHPRHQQHKLDNVGIYWSGDQGVEFKKETEEMFDYLQHVDSLQKFTGTHPAVMSARIAAHNWKLEFDLGKKRLSLKDRLLYWIEKKTGKRLFDYRNYRVI